MAGTARASSKRIRYAVIGLGHIARVAVLPAFAHAKQNSVLEAIVSGDREKLATPSDRYHVPVRASYDDFDLRLSEVDAVYIAAPNTEHATYAIRAADAGVHVLCKKPLATTDEECRHIVRACRDANVKVMTA